MDIVIIGAGASGLVAGIFAKNEMNNVTILERYEKSAKKILATGNGRCNYWNEDFRNTHFYSSNIDFIKEVNTLKNREEVLNFFNTIGIVPTIKNGYYYPMSKEASSVRNALINKALDKKINILENSNVIDVKKEDNKFVISYNDKTITCDKLIIATGSNSYYKDENLGYNICQNLGHNIIKVMPSLVQLITKDKDFKECDGVRNNSVIKIYVNNELEKKEEGEVLLTDYGLSGICVFNVSGIASRAINNNQKVEISINFLPQIDNLKVFLEERNRYLNNRKLDVFLEGLLNYKIIRMILKKLDLEYLSWNDLNDFQKKLLINTLTNYKVEISRTKSFIDSQVCTGGVDTKEINPKTFESKVCNNLYVIGELLDVDGDCGGYNLGFAWLSGMIAGKSVNND